MQTINVVIQQNNVGVVINQNAVAIAIRRNSVSIPIQQNIISAQIIQNKVDVAVKQIGPKGQDGAGGLIIGLAAIDGNAKAGQAIYMKNSGHIDLARADNGSTANVVGLAQADANSGNVCSYISAGTLDLPNWTNVIGLQNLIPGATYYLDNLNNGMLTTAPPSMIGHYVLKVGTALSQNILFIEIEQKILL